MPIKARTVVVIKGSPAVGKSYISRKLLARMPSHKARISIDEIMHLDGRGSPSRAKTLLALRNAADLVRGFIRDGASVVVEYTFDRTDELRYFLEEIKNWRCERKIAMKVCVVHLSATLSDVQKRNRKRDPEDNDSPMPAGLLKKLHARCEATVGEVEGEVVIDTSSLGIHATLDAIVRACGRSR